MDPVTTPDFSDLAYATDLFSKFLSREVSECEIPADLDELLMLESIECGNVIYYQPLSLLATLIATDPDRITKSTLIRESYTFRDTEDVVDSLMAAQRKYNRKWIPCYGELEASDCPPKLCVQPIGRSVTCNCGSCGVCSDGYVNRGWSIGSRF